MKHNQLFVRILILIFFLTNYISAQEIIENQTVISATIKGDIAVIGNNVLGVNQNILGVDFNLNDNFNILNAINNNIETGYIDIDSDSNFNAIFSDAFKADTNNFDYPESLIGSEQFREPTGCSTIGTYGSSAANLDISANCNKVVSAYLYWSATYPGEVANGSTVTPRGEFCNSENPNIIEDFTEVKILPPFADQYYDISIDPNSTNNPDGIKLQTEVLVDGLANSFYNLNTPRNSNDPFAGVPGDPLNDTPYACRANVTDLFKSIQENHDSTNPQSASTSGFWTVANVRSTVGTRTPDFNFLGGTAAGWTLAVIYEDNRPETTSKNIHFIDGFNVVNVGEDPINFNVNFNNTPFGNTNIWMASASLEGDSNLTNDQLLIETESSKINFPGSIINNGKIIANSLRPLRESTQDNSNNFFNSTITNLDGNLPRLPMSLNTLGFDTDHFEVPNDGNTIINNGSFEAGSFIDTSATIHLFTQGDAYYNFFNAFVIENTNPDIRFVKRVFNESGTLITEDTTVNYGETLTYEFSVKNTGNDDAVNIQFSDLLPDNVSLDESFDISDITFINFPETPVDITISNSTITNRAVNSNATQLIEFSIPNLSKNGVSSIDRPNEVFFKFDVQVIDECSSNRNACVNVIENIAFLSYGGELNTNSFSTQSSFDFDTICGSSISGPTISLIEETESCPSIEIDLCSNPMLNAGAGFSNYEWYFIAEEITDSNNNGFFDDDDFSITDGVNLTNESGNSSIFINEPGLYIVIGETDIELCTNSKQTFNVINSLDSIDSPFTQTENIPLLTNICTVNGGTELPVFEICDTLPLEFTTNYSSGTQLILSSLDNTSCGRLDGNDSCPFIELTCTYTIISNNFIDNSNSSNQNFVIDQEGAYSLEVVLPTGCSEIFYFETQENPTLCIILSNDDFSFENNSLKLYPNPTSGILNINTAIDLVSVYDITGALLMQKANTNNIDIGTLAIGVYFVITEINGVSTYNRVIKE